MLGRLALALAAFVCVRVQRKVPFQWLDMFALLLLLLLL